MIYECLSNPYEGGFFATAEKLAVRQLNRTVEAANVQLQQQDLEPVDIAEDAVSVEQLSTRCWSPEVGSTQYGIYRSDPSKSSASWISCQLNLGCFLFDLIPDIELVEHLESPIIAAGHLISEPYVEIKGTNGRLVISNDNSMVLELERVSAPDVLPVWSDVGHSVDIIRLGSGAVCNVSDGAWVDHWDNETPRGPLASDFDNFKDEIESAMAFFESESPHYYVWICALLREIVPLANPGGGTTNSRSFGMWPGQIQISTGASFLSLVSMLVHECSHQYFHMARWFDQLAYANAPEVYSVLREMSRPLEKVLLGYHAFGNVWLAFDSIRNNGEVVHNGDMASQEKHVANYVRSLDDQLKRRYQEFLTPAGRTIYLTLRQALVDRDLVR